MATLHRSKTAAEKFRYTLDFTNALPSGITVASGTVTSTKKSDGSTDTTIFESTTMTVSSPTAYFEVKAGTSGETYRIVATLVGSTASAWTKVVYMDLRVQDAETS